MIGLFPGQGVSDIRITERVSPVRREIYSYLEDLLETRITQDNYLEHSINSPLTVAYGISNYMQWKIEFGETLKGVAGYSVGHFASLVAASALSWQDAIHLVVRRAKLMTGMLREGHFSMVALIGPDEKILEDILSLIPHSGEFTAAITNYNSPVNHTIAGKKDILEWIVSKIPKEKLHKVIYLDNLGAWHSPFLNPLIENYRSLIDSFSFDPPKLKIYSNVTGRILFSDQIKDDLLSHLVSPVKWHQLITGIRNEGYKFNMEFGEAGQLSKMMFFSFRDMKCKCFPEGK